MNLTTRRTALAGLVLAATLTGCSALADQSAGDNAKAPAAGPAAAGTAQHALAQLMVKGPAPMTGYDREAKFGPAWSDSTTAPGAQNSCDTRNDVLRRDLQHITFKGTSRCVVATGTLADPYTGKTIHFVRGPQSAQVQIDHVVALGASWRVGAAQLTQQQRAALGNDPENLIAAAGRRTPRSPTVTPPPGCRPTRASAARTSPGRSPSRPSTGCGSPRRRRRP